MPSGVHDRAESTRATWRHRDRSAQRFDAVDESYWASIRSRNQNRLHMLASSCVLPCRVRTHPRSDRQSRMEADAVQSNRQHVTYKDLNHTSPRRDGESRRALEVHVQHTLFRRLTVLAGIATIAGIGTFAGWGGSAASAAGSTKTTATVHATKLSVGEVLVTEAGRTLYVFSLDARKTPKCVGTYAKFYPPLLTTHAPTAGKGVLKGLLGDVKTSTGKLQVTYNHWPLYTFVEDKAPGQVHAQMRKVFGGEFATIGSAGHSPFPAASPPPSSTTTTTTPGYNY